MANWITKLFNPNNTAAQPESDGYVRLADDKAIYSTRWGYRETTIDLNNLQYVYFYATENCQNLVLNDYHQHFIRCDIPGFDVFFQELSHRFPLDEKKFYEALSDKKALKLELWRASVPDNCRIVDSHEEARELQKGLNEGFRVSTEDNQLVSWDMTSEALASLPFAYQTTNEYGQTEIRFKHPVRLGNLEIDDWRYYLPVHLRLDVPLDSFYANLHIQGNGDQNYFLAKKALQEIMGDPTEGYERDDQNVSEWLFEGLKISLIYWYDSASSYESGYAYLGLKNERAYPHYLTDEAYEMNGSVSNYLLPDQRFQIGSDFRRSRYFLHTPQFIIKNLSANAGKFMIWLDEKNSKVGFANEEHAMIFPLKILVSFQLQNVLPGRSGGGTYLSAVLKEGNPQSVLIGDCYTFDPFVTRLADLTQIPVEELTPYEN